MKNLFLIIAILMSSTVVSISQTESEIFYKYKIALSDRNYKLVETKNERKAIYKDVIKILPNSSKTVMRYDISKDSEIRMYERSYYYNDELDLWNLSRINIYNKQGKEIDFKINYSNERFSSLNYFSVNRRNLISDNPNMTPPKINHSSFIMFIYTTLVYPKLERDLGIEGEVTYNLKISKDGELEVISILESSHPMLEKQGYIMFQKSPNWIPATINGKNVDSYCVQKVKFKLEG